VTSPSPLVSAKEIYISEENRREDEEVKNRHAVVENLLLKALITGY
jgi:hypothetical protein